MKTIYLLRHGQTNWNLFKDIPYSKENHNCHLNENGIKQAKELAALLKDKNIEYIYSSNLLRAQDTTKIISKILNVNYEIVEGLEEFSMYDDSIVGLLREQRDKIVGIENFNKCYDNKDDLMDWRPLNCETKREARTRIYKTILDICSKTNYNTIAIASHGSILREFMRACNIDQEKTMNNCDYTKIIYNNSNFLISGSK